MSSFSGILKRIGLVQFRTKVISFCYLRWWCDCTASWREKWSKVRNERNKARDECKRLRSKLESYNKDVATLTKEKKAIEGEVEQLKSNARELNASSPPQSPKHESVKDSELKQENHSLKKQLTQLSAQLDKSTKNVYHERESVSFYTLYFAKASRKARDICVCIREKLKLQKCVEGLNAELSRLRLQQEELVTSRNDIVQQV